MLLLVLVKLLIRNEESEHIQDLEIYCAAVPWRVYSVHSIKFVMIIGKRWIKDR